MHPYHILLAVLVTAVWGCNFIFVKLGLNEIPPFLLCTLRFLLVSIPVVFFIPKPKIAFSQIIYYGLFTFGFQFAFLFMGMQADMPAGLSSLIFQIQVFFSLILAAIILDEKPSSLQVIGGIISFLGLGLVWSKISHSASWVGFVLEICGAASWAVGNLVTKKIGRVNSLSLVAWGCLVSTPPLLVLSLIMEGPALIVTSLQHISWLAIASVVFITYISTLFGYGVWNWLLGLYPVASVIPFGLLVPMFGMFGSSLVFHEPMEPWKLNAACLIILGLSINVFGPRLLTAYLRKPKEEPVSEPIISPDASS
ncbi:MAG: EamA family transporter [Legionellaceae bacterium]|nr:EamA family transporter [Legionellaceae bacterium]